MAICIIQPYLELETTYEIELEPTPRTANEPKLDQFKQKIILNYNPKHEISMHKSY